jgi:hypothetical protein
MTRGGLPHSDIPGSKLVCSSPRLFAACHVLHRLLAPRHSPYTLSSLTIKLKTDAHQSFAYQLVCDSFFRNTARVCGRKKLPCAEYSVVKDQSCRAMPAICLRRLGWRAAFAAQRQPPPTSVRARLHSLIRSPKLFQRARLLTTLDNPKTCLAGPPWLSSYGGQPSEKPACQPKLAVIPASED